MGDVEDRQVAAAPCRSRSRLRTPSRIDTSSIDTGSSASSTSGSAPSARAIATRWRCPPDSSCGNLSRYRSGGVSWTRVQQVAQVRLELGGVLARPAVDLQRAGQVVAHGVHRVQRGERVLEDHLHPAAVRAERAAARAVDRLAVQPDVAGGARVELGEQPGDRGLARAGLADQGGDPAAAQRQVRRRRPRGRPCGSRVEQVAQPAPYGEVLGEARRPRAPRRWHRWLGHRHDRTPRLVAPRRRGVIPARGTLTEAGGLQVQDDLQRVLLGGLRPARTGPPRPASRSSSSCCTRPPTLGAEVGMTGICSTMIFCSVFSAVVRVASSVALAYSSSAVVASGLLKRPKLPLTPPLPTGLQDRAVHDVLVDVVRRRAAVGPVHARRRSCRSSTFLNQASWLALSTVALMPIVDRLSLMISRSVM